MAATLGQGAAASSLESRIDRMHRGDRFGALAFVIALWFTVLFTLAMLWPHLTNGTIRTILVISGAGLLLLNTAAIAAMLRHYAGDKHFIYGLDLQHLDEMRRRRG